MPTATLILTAWPLSVAVAAAVAGWVGHALGYAEGWRQGYMQQRFETERDRGTK